jgi:hypothetical protein
MSDAPWSLCETCAHRREIVTPRGSRFLLCRRSIMEPCYPRYPPQPVVRCDGHETRDESERDEKG